MDNQSLFIPVCNNGNSSMELCIEPEGEVVTLDPEEQCRVVLLPETGQELALKDLGLAIVWHSSTKLLLYTQVRVEVWKNGVRVVEPLDRTPEPPA